MSKIDLKMVEQMQLPWEYGQTFHPDSTYVRTIEIVRNVSIRVGVGVLSRVQMVRAAVRSVSVRTVRDA